MKQTQFEQLIEKWKDDPEFVTEGVFLDITEEICRVMEEQNISKDELAEKLGVEEIWVEKLLDDPVGLTIQTMVSIAIALGVSVKIQFV